MIQTLGNDVPSKRHSHIVNKGSRKEIRHKSVMTTWEAEMHGQSGADNAA